MSAPLRFSIDLNGGDDFILVERVGRHGIMVPRIEGDVDDILDELRELISARFPTAAKRLR